jgi:hypothetical protein
MLPWWPLSAWVCNDTFRKTVVEATNRVLWRVLGPHSTGSGSGLWYEAGLRIPERFIHRRSLRPLVGLFQSFSNARHFRTRVLHQVKSEENPVGPQRFKTPHSVDTSLLSHPKPCLWPGAPSSTSLHKMVISLLSSFPYGSCCTGVSRCNSFIF